MSNSGVSAAVAALCLAAAAALYPSFDTAERAFMYLIVLDEVKLSLLDLTAQLEVAYTCPCAANVCYCAALTNHMIALPNACCAQAPVHRWQSWDYSDPVYEIDRHPVCRSHSRKLSDLGAVQVRSRAASTAKGINSWGTG
jgi:hypothetical protein